MMLDCLRSLFLEALNNDLNDKRYSKQALIERWNKECDHVWQYKNDLIEEYKLKLAPKTGTWIKAECSEKNGDSNCSVCRHFDWSDCNYCSSCGSKNRRI